MFKTKEIIYIKNKYELIRNFLSVSFYNRYEISNKNFFIFNFNFLDNTICIEKERVFFKTSDNQEYSKGSEKIGILSFCFGIGRYWNKKNKFKISSSFNLGFVWLRDNAINICNYKKICDDDEQQYIQDMNIFYKEKNYGFLMVYDVVR